MSAGARARALSHLQVGAQLVGIGLTVWPWRAPGPPPLPALVLCVAGAVLGIAALAHNRIGNFGIYPEPRAHARLITTGPYALVRHPMYGALMLLMAGAAAWHGHWRNALGALLVAVAVVSKAAREERQLRARFDGYEAYRRRTRWFVPYLL